MLSGNRCRDQRLKREGASIDDAFPNAFIAEALATMKAVILYPQLGLNAIILEGDALEVVNGINSSRENWSILGLILQHTKDILEQMQFKKINHISRNLNVVVHRLAKEALNSTRRE